MGRKRRERDLDSPEEGSWLLATNIQTENKGRRLAIDGDKVQVLLSNEMFDVITFITAHLFDLKVLADLFPSFLRVVVPKLIFVSSDRRLDQPSLFLLVLFD